MAKQRLSAATIAPDGYKALIGVETYIRRCGLEQQLIELVKMRASQINGCAYCLDMHSRDARRAGESEQRLYLLDAWHEASVYTPRERAALAWTEAVTRIADTHAPDDAYEALRPHSSLRTIDVRARPCRRQDRDPEPTLAGGESVFVSAERPVKRA